MATTTLYVTASNHDAWQGGGGTTINGTYLQIDTATRWGGFWFNAAAIPQGSTINSAVFSYSPNGSAYDDPNCRWYGQASDTAAVFTTGATDISDRPLTTNYTTDNATDVGVGYRAITVTAAVQEIVNRPGWTGPIVIIGDGQATVAFRIEAYDALGSYPAKLVIDYTPPPAGGNPVKMHHYLQMMGG